MSYLSLYRRYRPQRFEDVLGQDHVTTALSNAVRTGKVTHAYLFSGPRGTGKTSSARILAKALNCTDLQGGEPCGACASCISVVAGTSMDVFELDAASNNGVDAMRDLVGRASLGTPGRHKVYIVDEVHMLSTAASNALLKTLEEPPEHVVFVLATTDPQKVLPTIRSRTQPFEFRLLSTALLAEHLRRVALDAGIDVDAAAIDIVARRGNGSARDALSALDQAAAAGGVEAGVQPVDDLVAAIGRRDTAAALAAVEASAASGREPRQLGRDLVESLRRAFLAHVAPGVLEASPDPVDAPPVSAAQATRGMEVIGQCLVDMRESLDPRIDLEVALVRLTRADLDTSIGAIVERLDRLERGLPVAASPAVATSRPEVAVMDAATTTAPLAGSGEGVRPEGAHTDGPAARGVAAAARAALGGSAKRTPAASGPPPTPAPLIAPLRPLAPNPAAAAAPAPEPSPVAADPATAGPVAAGPATADPATTDQAAAGPVAAGPATADPAAAGPVAADPVAAGAGPAEAPAVGDAPAPTQPTTAPSAGAPDLAALWPEVLASMPRNRAWFSLGEILAAGPTSLRIGLPNEMHRARCADRLPEVEAAMTALAGRGVTVELVVSDGSAAANDEGPLGPPPADDGDRRPTPLRETAGAEARATLRDAGPIRFGAPTGSAGRTNGVDDMDDFDPNELRDATDAGIGSTLDQFTRAFPGAMLVDGP